MKTIKIFLASSEELTEDRNAFGNLVRRLDKIYEKRGIRIELFEWEDYDAAYNDCRKQDEYNDQIKASDMFLALFRILIIIKNVTSGKHVNHVFSNGTQAIRYFFFSCQLHDSSPFYVLFLLSRQNQPMNIYCYHICTYSVVLYHDERRCLAAKKITKILTEIKCLAVFTECDCDWGFPATSRRGIAA